MLNGAETTTETSPTRINYRAWMLRVVVWDGVIAVLLMLAPLVLQRMLIKDGQNDENERMMWVVFIPIGAFLLRWLIGGRHLDTNHCSPNFRQFQTFCFFLGLGMMLFGDCLVLSLHDMLPADQALVPFLMLMPFYAIYLVCMIIAMYPGREPIPAEELTRLGNWEIGS
jgi:hypothetical protein